MGEPSGVGDDVGVALSPPPLESTYNGQLFPASTAAQSADGAGRSGSAGVGES
ncbi:MAG: hypothetical protein U1U88_002066 [Lawsonella clevelandensis]